MSPPDKSDFPRPRVGTGAGTIVKEPVTLTGTGVQGGREDKDRVGGKKNKFGQLIDASFQPIFST